MRLFAVLLLIGLPLAEIAAFIQVGQWLGLGLTLALVLLAGLAGILLIRHQSLATLGAHPPSNHDRLPERLAEELRPAYPRVVIVRADPMATYTGQPVLYAYRDGSARSGARS